MHDLFSKTINSVDYREKKHGELIYVNDSINRVFLSALDGSMSNFLHIKSI